MLLKNFCQSLRSFERFRPFCAQPCVFRSQFLTSPPSFRGFSIVTGSFFPRRQYASSEETGTQAKDRTIPGLRPFPRLAAVQQDNKERRSLIKCLRFDARGVEEKAFSKYELMAELRLPHRDLRTIVAPVGGSSIVVRDKAIIFHMLHVRAVIEWDHVLLFDFGQPGMDRIIDGLRAATVYDPYSPRRAQGRASAFRSTVAFPSSPLVSTAASAAQGARASAVGSSPPPVPPTAQERMSWLTGTGLGLKFFDAFSGSLPAASATPASPASSATASASATSASAADSATFAGARSSAGQTSSSADCEFEAQSRNDDGPGSDFLESGSVPSGSTTGRRFEIDEDLPFEFAALEALLIEVTAGLRKQFQDSEPDISFLLDRIMRNIEPPSIELLKMRKKLNHLEKSIQECHQAMHQLLTNNDDMASMYLTVKSLTGHKRRIDLHDEVETLLETYDRQLERTGNDVSYMKHSIEDTEEHYQLALDIMRNEMMTLTLVLTVLTFGTSVSMLLFSAFGMNVPNGLETSSGAFASLVTLSGASSLILVWFMLRYMRMRKVAIWTPRASRWK
eukprot:TRINITY_DN10038_c0_g1_i1.p1 TRINITY_DN10038_c0_g1~~TRINITY_DN10038_c0_g1_i1.p1  ORF type:complete len:564 (-),score=180.72 TRINITY_DN10038_c0_g1_i1:237-1928(-)